MLAGTSSASRALDPTQQHQQHQQQQQPPRNQHHQQQQHQQQLEAWRADRRVGLISIAMWLGTAIRVCPALSAWENTQSVVAMVVMYVVVVAWPTYATAHYMQWRVPALSFLRVFLVALPFNFSTTVFDAIAPTVATGRLAVVANSFQAFLAVRIALLTFTSLGWRVPFRLHLLLQSINVGLLVWFGLEPYSNSKLLSSPQLQAVAAAVHRSMGLFASVFLPTFAGSSTHAPPLVPAASPYAQRLSFLLFCWAVLGWLMPTLLLLPAAETVAAARQAGAGGGGGGNRCQGLPGFILVPIDRLLTGMECGLATLQPPWQQQQRRRRRLEAGTAQEADEAATDGEELLTMTAAFVLAWCVVLMSLWMMAWLLAGACETSAATATAGGL